MLSPEQREIFALEERIDELESQLAATVEVGEEAILGGVAVGEAWPGLVFFNGKRYYDSDLYGAPQDGAAITDNSAATGENSKKFIKINAATNVVSYEDGPAPGSGTFPDAEEWYEVDLQLCPIHVTRF